MPQLSPTNPTEQHRLHILFNRWVPNSSDLTHAAHTLNLGREDIAAIRAEITSYRLQTALAKRTNTPYLAPWETLELLKATVADQNAWFVEQMKAVQTAEARARALEESGAAHAETMAAKNKVITEHEDVIKQLAVLLEERDERVKAAKEAVDRTLEMTGKMLAEGGPSFWSVTQADRQFLWIIVVGLAAFLLGVWAHG